MSKIEHATTTGGAVIYEEPDELTQREIERALTILRWIKRNQRGWMIACPSVGGGRELHISGPLEKAKAA